MFLRQLDLTTALRPSFFKDETLLFVQAGVGLYEGKYKIPDYQDGSAYLTSHRVCYVANAQPRKFSVAIDLKDIERTEFYAGFLKSSPKITLFPKPPKSTQQAIRNPAPKHALPSDTLISPTRSSPRPLSQSPGPLRDGNATWICPICGLSNGIPANFDPYTANEFTPLLPCQACGIKPSLVHINKAAIAAMSNRSSGAVFGSLGQARGSEIPYGNGLEQGETNSTRRNPCPRCTFKNHRSLHTCEMCGASLTTSSQQQQLMAVERPDSPGPTLDTSIVGNDTIETIKFSFREGGVSTFLDRLKTALVQRKWLLQSAPPVPQPVNSNNGGLLTGSEHPSRSGTPQRVVGIAGLERRGAELRQNNQAVIGTAFEDLEALMTSAKEVIAMAEQFAKQNNTDSGVSPEARDILTDSASALGLVTTRDMLGSGSASETLYITELSRNLAEFLTDDRRGVLRKEGGIMSLVDLWAVFNRLRNGIELISPLDFEKAAIMWDSLNLPIRLRRFKSGLLVVQERSRTDEKTIAALVAWLKQPQNNDWPQATGLSDNQFGRGATAQEAAERFGWSVGVATEELEMAEETGALCRDQCLDGTRFWQNLFATASKEIKSMQTKDEMGFDELKRELPN
ncbi:Hypothetical protein R9X50_00271900 [Acrodontium crateriforme]|uniref:Vacuolar protein-sorting-associated protein 36 n=1 Tax=Acrodontium crateriforme TaxID=150365 RepID=A0AAQ3M308_9PEZI|nr:Hypothetical protein R9X50_00271900 [Acrodontium crateriforme]